MKIGIMQPYFFPYLGYFQLINAVDTFVFFDDVNFIKKGWIHRNNILVNNSAYRFTLSLDKPSQNKLINEIYLSADDKWKDNLVKTIEQSYKKAPFFEFVFPLIENIIASTENKTISTLAIESIQDTLSYLNIEKAFKLSSQIIYDREGSGQEKILSICKMLNGSHYLNAVNGQDLYNKVKFSSQGLKLSFIKTEGEIQYQQFNYPDFIPNLSIIDILMFNSAESVNKMLKQYKLI